MNKTKKKEEKKRQAGHLEKFTSRKFLIALVGVVLFLLRTFDVNIPDEVLYPVLAYILGEAGVDIAKVLSEKKRDVS